MAEGSSGGAQPGTPTATPQDGRSRIGVHLPTTPRTAGPMPRQTDLLELRESYTQGGIWGVGLTIDKASPHAVLHIQHLVDRTGGSAKGSVSVGDRLLRVDDLAVQDASIDSIESVVFGPEGSVVKLSMAAAGDGRHYDVYLMRHVPINVWDRILRWYELLPDYKDQDFIADNDIIRVLEGMRCFCHDGSGNLADLLKDNPTERSTLGIHVTLPPDVGVPLPPGFRPGQIRDLTLGGPAFLSGQVRVGDEIIAVDGEAVHDAESIMAATRGSDDIGTMCTMTLMRDHHLLDVTLTRGSSTRMRTVETLFKLVQAASAHVHKGNMNQALQALSLLSDNLAASESGRMHRERRLADRLSYMQSMLFNDITAAEKRLHPLPDLSEVISKAVSEALSQVSSEGLDPAAMMDQGAVEPSSPPEAPHFGQDDTLELISLRGEAKLLAEKLAQASQVATDTDAEMSSLKLQLSELKKTCSELQATCRKLTDVNELLLQEKAAEEGAMSKLKDQLKSCESDNHRELGVLRGKLNEHKRLLAEMESQRNEARLQADHAQQECATLQKGLQSLNFDVESHMQELRNDRLTLAQEISGLRADKDNLHAKISALQEERLHSKEAADELQDQIEPLTRKIADLENELEAMTVEAQRRKEMSTQVHNELWDLKKLLSPLADRDDLVKLNDVMGKPPKFFLIDMFEIFEVLKDRQNPRWPKEVHKIISIMNQGTPWNAEQLQKARDFCSELKLRSLDDLQAMSNQFQESKGVQRRFDTLHAEHETLLAEHAQLKQNCAHLKQRYQQLEAMKSDMEKALAMSGGLQRQVADEREQKDALKKKLAKTLAALETSRSKECVDLKVHKVGSGLRQEHDRIFETELADLKTELAEKERQLSATLASLDEAREKWIDAEKHKIIDANPRHGLEAQLAELKQELAEKERLLSSARASLREHSEHSRLLEQLHESHSLAHKLQEQLKDSQTFKLQLAELKQQLVEKERLLSEAKKHTQTLEEPLGETRNHAVEDQTMIEDPTTIQVSKKRAQRAALVGPSPPPDEPGQADLLHRADACPPKLQRRAPSPDPQLEAVDVVAERSIWLGDATAAPSVHKAPPAEPPPLPPRQCPQRRSPLSFEPDQDSCSQNYVHGQTRQCGIGLLLESNNNSLDVLIKDVVPRSPADMCGKIRPGDKLLKVNATLVAGLPLKIIETYVVGDEGTQVELEIRMSNGSLARGRVLSLPSDNDAVPGNVQRIVLTRGLPILDIPADQALTRTLPRIKGFEEVAAHRPSGAGSLVLTRNGFQVPGHAAAGGDAESAYNVTPTAYKYDLFGLPFRDDIRKPDNTLEQWPRGSQSARSPHPPAWR